MIRAMLLVILLPGIADAVAPPTIVLRYVRPAKGGFILESLITERASGDGVAYRSLTDRGSLKMTLSFRIDSRHRILDARALLESGDKAQSVSVSAKGHEVMVTREGKTERLAVSPDVVVTTAPDWSDIIWVIRRYDRVTGGKQEFAGLWIHPVQPSRVLNFTVEPERGVRIEMAGKPILLHRYRVTLRSGAYLVWADENGRVVCLMPPGRPGAAVILAGFEKAVADLK